MKHMTCLLAASLLILPGCADRWSDTGANGARFAEAEPACRAAAQASARRQLPDEYDRDYGPAGVPPITRKDIERRETARCLQDKGFRLSRSL